VSGSVDPRAVCAIGVGQRTWRPDDPELVEGCAPEPLAMWEHVVRAAAADATVGSPSGTVDAVLGRLADRRVIYSQTWQYDDPAGRLAERLGLGPGDGTYTGIGGTRPLQELASLATRIAAGEVGAGVVVSGEALATVRRINKAGEKPAFSHRDPERKPFPLEAPFLDTEISHEVFQAWLTFATWDVGRRAARGDAPDAYRGAIGTTMAPLTDVASGNPHAWFPVARSADQLVTATADNRMVGYPYTKLVVSVMDVDMAAAVILTSAEVADELGVPADRRAYLRGWCYGTDPTYLAEHDSFAAVPGMAATTGEALRVAGAGIDDVAHLDLYSCFPSSLHHGADALGISPTDPRGLTVTGGLPYFGGPGSGYGTHAVATMVDVLRRDPRSLGLTTGVGMHMTKHAAALWSTTPPTGALPIPDEVAVQAALDARPRRTVQPTAAGPATVATYSVVHGRDGAPEWALVVADLPSGDRCYARAVDGDLLAALEADEWVGRPVVLRDGGGGVNLVEA